MSWPHLWKGVHYGTETWNAFRLPWIPSVSGRPAIGDVVIRCQTQTTPLMATDSFSVMHQDRAPKTSESTKYFSLAESSGVGVLFIPLLDVRTA
ncbi:hypothetical protein ZHAS_00013822 [Anopheles sinensis]|uniref:Uncharacterized protein n=1 Tax=Anopheles sinensis TaxID=74873 RepID=A0A084W6M0_ANOSI|nr:hypothetical protein ZHAS_00013822 [Anopheles sinensis]